MQGDVIKLLAASSSSVFSSNREFSLQLCTGAVAAKQAIGPIAPIQKRQDVNIAKAQFCFRLLLYLFHPRLKLE